MTRNCPNVMAHSYPAAVTQMPEAISCIKFRSHFDRVRYGLRSRITLGMDRYGGDLNDLLVRFELSCPSYRVAAVTTLPGWIRTPTASVLPMPRRGLRSMYVAGSFGVDGPV